MKATITGRNGLIGRALWSELSEMGWQLYPYLRPDVDFVFLFGSPSSTVQYEQDMAHCFRQTIGDFVDAIDFCKQYNIRFIYPSSATVQKKNTPYAHAKACLEEIQAAFGIGLGLRIFAGYGPGEDHKGDYASVIYQWCRQVKRGETPVIFGNGTQTRDFVYVDDIVSAIVGNLGHTGLLDIGTGVNTSFNEVLNIIGQVSGKEVVATYVDKPPRYVEETVCISPLRFYMPLKMGIQRIWDAL
jgi:UDP-glucose 4-epimerase